MKQRDLVANLVARKTYWLLDFLLQSIKFRCGEEFTQRNIQTVANHFDGDQFWILAFSVQDILNTGGWQCRECCEFIDTDFSFATQLQDTVTDRCNGIHKIASLIVFY